MNVRFGPTTSTPRRCSRSRERVEEPRRAVQPDRGLAGARAALDDERAVRVVRDQAVLVGLDRRDDVAHVRVARRARAPRAGSRRRAAPSTIEPSSASSAMSSRRRPSVRKRRRSVTPVRVLRRRRVERARRGRLPVDDELLLLLVVHPAPADVERPADRLEVEPAEAEAALGVLVRAQPLGRPRVHRGLRDLAVDAGRPRRRRPARMRSRCSYARSTYACSVCKLRVAHATHRNADLRGAPAVFHGEPPRVRRARRRRAVRAARGDAAPAPRRARHLRRRVAPRGRRPATRFASSARSRRCPIRARSSSSATRASSATPRSARSRSSTRTRVRHVVRGFDEPRYTAAHPDGVHAFVTDSGRSGVAVVDVAARPGRRARAAAGLGAPRHDRLRRATLWVGLGTASEHVAVVDDSHAAPSSDALTPGFARARRRLRAGRRGCGSPPGRAAGSSRSAGRRTSGRPRAAARDVRRRPRRT